MNREACEGLVFPSLALTVTRDEYGLMVRRSDGRPMGDVEAEKVLALITRRGDAPPLVVT